MFGLSGLGLKLMIAAIIIAAVTATIGGFWLYQKSIISDLESKIADQQKTINVQKEQIAGLIIDKQKLQTSNNSLEGEIKRKADETKAAYAEIDQLRKKDLESDSRLQAVEKQLRDKERLQRIEAIRNSQKATLLIRIMDQNIKCFADHFDDVNGKCILGRWVPTGGRLVPKTPPTTPPTK